MARLLIGNYYYCCFTITITHFTKSRRLELFEVEDLKVFAKEGQQQILTAKGTYFIINSGLHITNEYHEGKKDNFDWYASASFTINNTGLVTAVRLEVKSLSDNRPLVKVFLLSISFSGWLMTKHRKSKSTLMESNLARVMWQWFKLLRTMKMWTSLFLSLRRKRLQSVIIY